MERRTFFRLTAATAAAQWLPLVGCGEGDVTYGAFVADVRARTEGLVFFDQMGRSYTIDPSAAEILSSDTQGASLGRLAENVRLSTPAAVCAADDGTRFIVDRGSGRLLRLGDDGRVDLLIGRAGTEPGTFMMPSDADARGAEIYVADTLNHRIQVLDTEGRVQRTLGTPGTGEGELNAPTGVACARDRVFVASSGNGRVEMLSHDGAHLGTFDSPGPRFNPTGVATRGSNEVLVISTNECKLYVFDAHGALLEQREVRDVDGRLSHPVALTVDPVSGAVLVSALPGPPA